MEYSYVAQREQFISKVCEWIAARCQSINEFFDGLVADVVEETSACCSKKHSLERLRFRYMWCRFLSSRALIEELDSAYFLDRRISDEEFCRHTARINAAIRAFDEALDARINEHDNSRVSKFIEKRLTARDLLGLSSDPLIDRFPKISGIIKHPACGQALYEYGPKFDYLQFLEFLAGNGKDPAELTEQTVDAYVRTSMRNEGKRQRVRAEIKDHAYVSLESAREAAQEADALLQNEESAEEMGLGIGSREPATNRKPRRTPELKEVGYGANCRWPMAHSKAKAKANGPDVKLDIKKALSGLKPKHREKIEMAITKGLGLRSDETAEELGIDSTELDAARKALERDPRVRKLLAAYKPNNPRQ